MVLTTLLALLFAGLAIWIFQQTSEDVYIVLAIAILLICFIIGFAQAHWGLQALIALSLLALDRIYGRDLIRSSKTD